MIAKIIKGKGFRGALNYTIQKQGAQIVGGNMAAQDPRSLASEFGITRGHNVRCKQPVFHASLSLPPGERLSDEQWDQAAAEFLEKLGFARGRGQHQYIVVRHTDADHDHVHIVANRINMETLKAVDLRHDYRKSHEACRGLEQKFGLTQVSKRDFTKTPVAQGGKADTLRKHIDNAIRASGGDKDLAIGNLKRQGVEINFNQQKSGRVAGVTFVSDGTAFKGSELGKGYSLAGIDRRLESKKKLAAARAPKPADAIGRAAAQKLISAVPGAGQVVSALKTVHKLSKAASKAVGTGKDHDHEL